MKWSDAGRGIIVFLDYPPDAAATSQSEKFQNKMNNIVTVPEIRQVLGTTGERRKSVDRATYSSFFCV